MSDYGLGQLQDDEKLSSDALEILNASENNVILTGFVGAGKTSLLNTMTGRKFKTAAGGFSVTRQIQFAPCLDGVAICSCTKQD